MRKEIALLLVMTALVIGFFTGRKFPAHHYVMASAQGSTILVDLGIGQACDSLGKYHAQQRAASLAADAQNLAAEKLAEKWDSEHPTQRWDEQGNPIASQAASTKTPPSWKPDKQPSDWVDVPQRPVVVKVEPAYIPFPPCPN